MAETVARGVQVRGPSSGHTVRPPPRGDDAEAGASFVTGDCAAAVPAVPAARAPSALAARRRAAARVGREDRIRRRQVVRSSGRATRQAMRQATRRAGAAFSARRSCGGRASRTCRSRVARRHRAEPLPHAHRLSTASGSIAPLSGEQTTITVDPNSKWPSGSPARTGMAGRTCDAAARGGARSCAGRRRRARVIPTIVAPIERHGDDARAGPLDAHDDALVHREQVGDVRHRVHVHRPQLAGDVASPRRCARPTGTWKRW